MILVDKLTNASVSNGILRLSCSCVGADGTEKPSGEILIPVTRIGTVMSELNTVVKQLREQAQAHMDNKAAEGDAGADTAATTPGQQG